MFFALQDLLGRHEFHAGMEPQEIRFGDHRIVVSGKDSAFSYKRYYGQNLEKEATIVSDKDKVIVGVFPDPPLLTPKPVAKNVYLKFRTPIVVDQRSKVSLYAKIPIEIGVYRQSADEELLLDAFSLQRPQYALYGPPETGVVCRYMETEVSTTDEISVVRYEEALVRIQIKNMIDNVVRISKVIIPMSGVVLDHLNDDTQVPGNVEMHLDTAFGKDVVNVRLVDTKVKRPDKTSIGKKEETRIFLMDAGY